MSEPTEALTPERLAQIQRELAEMRVDAKHPIVLHIFDGIEGLLGMVEALTAEIDRLRVANDQLAQLLADRDQREDTLNDDIAALQAENQALTAHAQGGACTFRDQRDDLQSRIDAALALCDRDGYTTWDQDKHLDAPPWRSDDPKIIAWEKAHGHDVRMKCYPEFGCQLLIDPEDLRAALTGED